MKLHNFWFGFVDQLCQMINIFGTFIRSLFGCLAPHVGFRWCLVILPVFEIDWQRNWSLGRLGSVIWDLTLFGRFGHCDSVSFTSCQSLIWIEFVYWPIADSDWVDGSLARLSSTICRSANSVRWVDPSTISLSVSKETLLPTIFY